MPTSRPGGTAALLRSSSLRSSPPRPPFLRSSFPPVLVLRSFAPPLLRSSSTPVLVASPRLLGSAIPSGPPCGSAPETPPPLSHPVEACLHPRRLSRVPPRQPRSAGRERQPERTDAVRPGQTRHRGEAAGGYSPLQLSLMRVQPLPHADHLLTQGLVAGPHGLRLPAAGVR